MSDSRTYIGYWLIDPIAATYQDRYDSVPDLSYSHKTPVCGLIDVAVFLSTDARFVRVMVPSYSTQDTVIPAKDDEIASVVESVGALIRLSFNIEAKFSEYMLATTYRANERHIIEIYPKVVKAKLPIKPNTFRHGLDFSFSSKSNALLIHLLVDVHDESMPLQFRYLSLYKILELLLKNDNEWDYSALDQCITSAGIDATKPAGTNKAAKNWIHALRDQCAHFANRETLGISALDKESMRQISTAIPILGKVISIALGPEFGELFAELVSGVSKNYQLVDTISGKFLSEC